MGVDGAQISVVNDRLQLEGNDAASGPFLIGDTYVDDGTFSVESSSSPQLQILNTNTTNRYEFELDNNGNLGISGNLNGDINFENDVSLNTTSSLKLPAGTTAERHGTPVNGMIRYNSSNGQYEGYYTNEWRGLGGVGAAHNIDVDRDTYVTTEKTPDDDTLFFHTAGAERARIDELGKTYVEGDSFFASSVEITGDLSVAEDLSVIGNLSVLGDFDLGDTTTDRIHSKGDLIVEDQSFFGETVQMSGSLIVNDNIFTNIPTAASHVTIKSYVDSADDTLTTNLAATGDNLQTQVSNNDSDIATLTTNLASTGNNLQAQIASNDSDVSTLTTNLAATGDNLQTQVTNNDSDISTLTANLASTGDNLQAQVASNDSDITSLNVDLANLSGEAVLLTGAQTIAGDKTFSDDVTILGDLAVSGDFTLGDSTTDSITTRGDLFVQDDAVFSDQVDITGNLTVVGTASAATPTQNIHLTTKLYVDNADNTLTTNLASTGDNLQAQVWTNDTDIATLTTNLASTGDGLTTNLAATGDNLQAQVWANDTDIATLTTNLASTGDSLTTSLATTGDNLQAQVWTNDTDIATLTTNLASTGDNLQTQVTSNDSDISTLITNLAATGDNLTTDLAATGDNLQAQVWTNDTDISTLTTNLAATGDNLQAQVTSNDSDIASLNVNLDNLSGEAVLLTGAQTIAGNKTFLDDITLLGNLNASGDFTLGDQTTDRIYTKGDLYVEDDAYFGDRVYITGDLTVEGSLSTDAPTQNTHVTIKSYVDDADNILTTNLASLSGEAVLLTGNQVIAGNKTFSNDVSILGTTFTVDTSNVLVEDPVLLLAKNQVGTAALDAGFIVERGNDQNVGFIWDESSDHFTVINTTEIADDNDITIASYANFKGNVAEFASVGIGVSSPSVALDIASTNAIKLPVGTTAQRPTAANGMIRLNTSTAQFEGYHNGNWQGLGGVIDVDQDTYVSTEKSSDDDTLFFYTAGTERAKIDNAGNTFIAGDMTVSGSLAVSGDFTLGDETTDKITTRGDLFVQDDAFFADAVEITGSLTVDGTASAAAPTQNSHLTTKLYVDTADDTLTTNLAATGANLQTQVTSNDSDISTLTTNLAATGDNLQAQVWTNDTDISTLTTNLASTGDNLQAQVTSNDSDISTLTTNLAATGDNLQTQVTSNDSDITTLTTNLAATGDNLQAQVTSNDSDISTLTTNLASTGDNLQAQVTNLSGDAVLLAGNQTIAGDKTFSDDVTILGDLAVSGDFTLGDATTDRITTRGDLYVEDDAVFQDDITVTGDAHFAGSVGIGTLAPSAPLDVVTSASSTVYAAEINQSNTSNGDGLYVNIGSTSASDYVATFRSSNNNLFDIKGDGNVGIGTASPSVALDISSTNAVKIPVGTTAQRPTAADGLMRLNTTTNQFEGYQNSNWQGLGGVIDVDQDTYVSTEKTSDDDILFFYTAGSERARLTSAGFTTVGKVGLAGAPIHGAYNVNIAGTTALSFSSTAPVIGFTGTNAAAVITQGGTSGSIELQAKTLKFNTYTGSAWTDKMTILGDGNVGIGITAPGAKLHIADTARASIRIAGTATSNGTVSDIQFF